MDKKYFKAIKEMMRLEAYECGLFGKVKNIYRVIFCQAGKEFITQRLFSDGWLCLHK